MTDSEARTLIDQVTAGLPATLVQSRLRLILALTLGAGGAPAEAAFREAIASLARRDRGEAWTPPPSAPSAPRRP